MVVQERTLALVMLALVEGAVEQVLRELMGDSHKLVTVALGKCRAFLVYLFIFLGVGVVVHGHQT